MRWLKYDVVLQQIPGLAGRCRWLEYICPATWPTGLRLVHLLLLLLQKISDDRPCMLITFFH